MPSLTDQIFSQVLDTIILYGDLARELKRTNETLPEYDFRIYSLHSRTYRAYCNVLLANKNENQQDLLVYYNNLGQIFNNEKLVDTADTLMALIGWDRTTRE